MATPQSLTALELKARLEAGDTPVLVDVREAMELELAALQEPVLHLPRIQSEQWLGRLGDLLDRDRDIVVLCHAGIRSWQFACWLMDAQGYERVWNLHGGIDAWSVAADPSVPRY